MRILDLQHLVDVSEVHILVAARNFHALTFTSELLSFPCYSPSLHLFLCVFQQIIQYSPFPLVSLQLSGLYT